jgi:hypothetical protein
MTAGHPSRHVVLCLLALGGWAAPVVIWLLNSRGLTFGPAIPYGNNGHCDAWHYFGLATLGDSAWTIASNFRMSSRIVTYFPNYLLGKILPWNGAERYFMLNHSLVFIGALLAVLPLHGLGIAVLSAVLISTSALWIGMISVTYGTDAALAYGMLALACLTHAAVTRRRVSEHLLCLVAGVLLGWATNANLMAVVFFPFLPLVLLIDRDWRSAALYFDIALVSAGGLLGTALVGLAAVSIGQPFAIFWNQISAAIAGIGDWWNDEYLRNSVAIPLSLGLSAALICMLARTRDRRSMIIAAIVSLTTVDIFAQTFIPKSTSLLYDPFYVLFLAPALLGVAELIRNTSKPAVAVLAVIIAHLALMAAIAATSPLKAFYLSNSMSLTIACAMILLAAVQFRCKALLVASLFLLFQSALGPQMRAHWQLDPRKEKDRYDVTEAALVFVREFGISQLPVIWIDSDFDAHMMLSGYRSFVRCGFEPSFPAHLPDPKRHRQEPLAPGVLLVVLTSPQVTPSDVAQALRPHAMGLRDSRDRVITGGESAIRVTVGKVVALEQE